MNGWVALEEWKLRLTSAKVEVEVEAERGNRGGAQISPNCKRTLHRIILEKGSKRSTEEHESANDC